MPLKAVKPNSFNPFLVYEHATILALQVLQST